MLKDMFDNLLHIGNKTNYWNPQMKSYIHGSTVMVYILLILLKQCYSNWISKRSTSRELKRKLVKKFFLLLLNFKREMLSLNLLKKQETSMLLKNGFLDFLQTLKQSRRRIATYLKTFKRFWNMVVLKCLLKKKKLQNF